MSLTRSQTTREARFIIDMAKIGGFIVQYKGRYLLGGVYGEEYGWLDRDHDMMYTPQQMGCIYRLKPPETPP